MQGLAWAIGSAVVLATLYLLFWPVAVAPVAWDAPVDRGFITPYDSNNLMRRVQAYDIGPHAGAEDITSGHDGHLYSTSEDGAILRYGVRDVEIFAQTGGRPLGIEADSDGSLVVANAYLGLQRIALDGTVETILDQVDGQPLVYADDLAIASNGKIYFTEASTKFGAANSGGSYAASLLDLIEHGGHGLVIEFDPASGESNILLDGLNFANGIAISDDETFLLIAETGSYRILKYWLLGERAGQSEVLLDNLPAFPDNINSGRNGRFWIGLVAPRNALMDRFAPNPFLRKLTQRLPTRFRPSAVPHSQVIAINGDGVVLMNLHDAGARFPALTGVLETRDTLYFTSLFGHYLPYIRKQDL